MCSEIRCLADLIGQLRRPLTQCEVARVLGISRSRVDQLEKRALEKLGRDRVLKLFHREASENNAAFTP